LLVFAHFADEGLVFGAFVGRSPQNHFGENGGEVETFGGEQVDLFAAIGGMGTRGDDAVGFEAAKAVGEDVGGGAFVGVEEFLKGAGTAEHHVSDDEQGPAIAEHFDRGVQRTPRAAFRGRVRFGHVEKVSRFHLQYASEVGRIEIGK
jgi:hypothetical protein